jgi:hypothetical protein
LKEGFRPLGFAASFLRTRFFAADVFVFFPGKWRSPKKVIATDLGRITASSIPSVLLMGRPSACAVQPTGSQCPFLRCNEIVILNFSVKFQLGAR